MIHVKATREPVDFDLIEQIHNASQNGGVVMVDNNTCNYVSCVSKVAAAIVGVGTRIYIKGDPSVVNLLSEKLKANPAARAAGMIVHNETKRKRRTSIEGSPERKTSRLEADSVLEESFEFPISMDIVTHINSSFALSGDEEHDFGFYGICGFDMVKMTEKELRKTVEENEKNLLLFLPTEILVRRAKDAAYRCKFTFNGEPVKPWDVSSLVCGYERTEFPEPDNSTPYDKLVVECIPEFLAGNMTECVLSRERVLPCEKSPGQLFIDLMNLNRSEYCFFMKFGPEAVVVSSPEMFVKVVDRKVESYPIAGTIRRGATPEEDKENEATLLASFKDSVELAMCTDVDRNDKARICIPDSIQVLEKKLIKKYSHVMHTVDHVGGILRPELSSVDAFKAHMWAVTVTGSPRLNALRYLLSHETSPRKWYSGAAGVFRANGDITTCILIRFCHMLANGMCSIRAGASLIHLSDPVEEANEIRIKAEGMVKALTCPSVKDVPWIEDNQVMTETNPEIPHPVRKALPFADKKVVIVDYEDSFVNTVAYYLRSFVERVEVIRYNLVDWDALLSDSELSLVVLSPGPGSPSEYEIPKNVHRLRAKKIPILGVCLGFQGLMEADGIKVERIPVPRHGYQRVNTRGRDDHPDAWLWADIPAGHYHSLGVRSIPDSYIELCRDGDYVTGVQHKTEPIIAWQFHPESDLTAAGFGHKLFLHSLRLLLSHNKTGRWIFTSPSNRTHENAQGSDYISDLMELQASGMVDCVEVGVPYTDPIADGPVIQRAYFEALSQCPNMSVIDVIAKVKQARAQGFGLPVVLMGYMNTFFVHSTEAGFETRDQWEQAALECGIRQLILVDADVDAVLAHDLAAKLKGIKLIPVISEVLDEGACQFLCASKDYDVIYCTNYLGATGKDIAISQKRSNAPYMRMIKQLKASGKRILAGFGIKKSEDVDRVRVNMGCDYCVVGSQYLKLLQQGESVQAAVESIFGSVSDIPLADTVSMETVAEEQTGAPLCTELKVCGFGHPNEIIAAGMERVRYFGFLLEPSSKRCVQPALLDNCLNAVDTIRCNGYNPETVAVIVVTSLEDFRAKAGSIDERFNICQVFFKDMGEAAMRQTIEGIPDNSKLKWVINISYTQIEGFWEILEASPKVWGVGVDQKMGGTGVPWDYSSVLSCIPASFNKRLLLAGGVNPDNISELLNSIPATPRAKQGSRQYIIDVASGTCDDSGLNKDVYKIRHLARACGPLPLYYGPFGGLFVPQTIYSATTELTTCYVACLRDPSFLEHVKSMYNTMANRPTPLYEATNLTKMNGGATIWLKREDLLHTGAHKINNAIYQMIIARRMGKTRIIAETGAGQHGVAVATVCAQAGMQALIYMGADDVERQALNVKRIRLLGSEVIPCAEGDRTLGSAINAAMRDWVENIRDTHYVIGSALGPSPFPAIVRDAQSVIGREAREQMMRQVGVLPSAVVACVGGGSNAIGAFDAFIADHDVRLVGVEAGGLGPHKNAQSLKYGTQGVLHGSVNNILQDSASGQTIGSHSISAGLDYPGVSPIHCYLNLTKRCEYRPSTDGKTMEALSALSRSEGILPALESAHAVAVGQDLAREVGPGGHVIINLSGRGDKDMGIIEGYLDAQKRSAQMTSLCEYLTKKNASTPTPDKDIILSILRNEHTQEDMFRLFDAFNVAATDEIGGVPVERPAYILRLLREEILRTNPYTILKGDYLDIVGTGGDGKNPYNISTAAGLLAGSVIEGVQIVKHGNGGFTSMSGSKDMLTDLGFNVDLKANLNALMKKQHKFGFLLAPQTNPGFGVFGPLRKAYGKRSLFNFLGPLVNPLVNSTVTGVASDRMGHIYALVLQGELNGIIAYSADGVDKISPYCETKVWRLSRNNAGRPCTMETIDPAEALGMPADEDYLKAPDSEAEARTLNPGNLVSLLHGEKQEEDNYAKYVIINAAAALWVAGNVSSLVQGVDKIRIAIRDGSARAFFYETIYLSHHFGNKQGILEQIQKWVSFRPIRSPSAGAPLFKPRSFFHRIGTSGLFAEAKTRSPDFYGSKQSFESMVETMVSLKTEVISVLSDPIFFNGSLEQLRDARTMAGEDGPLILRKDFILSPHSIDESFQWGADTVLLIVRMYPAKEQLEVLINHTRSYDTEPLVEVASEAELDVAVACGAKVIGINNRDLTTFKMDKSKSIRLSACLREKHPYAARESKIIVLSGVSTEQDIQMYQAANLNHFLVGTLFGTSENPREACKMLQNAIRSPSA